MPRKERIRVPGKSLVETVKELVSRGESRQLCLFNQEKHLLDIPLAIGDPAAPVTVLEAPVLAALSAFSTLVNECTIEVERAGGPENSTGHKARRTG